MDGTQWSGLLGGMDHIAYWGYWREVLTYVSSLVALEATTHSKTIAEYARSTMVRELAERFEPELLRAGVLDQQHALPGSSKLAEWRAFHVYLADRIAADG